MRRPYNDGGRGAGVDSDFIGPARLSDFRLFRNATVAPHVQANIKALEPPLDRYSSHRSCAEPAAPDMKRFSRNGTAVRHILAKLEKGVAQKAEVQP